MKINWIIISLLFNLNISSQEYFSKTYPVDFANSSLTSDFIEHEEHLIISAGHVCQNDGLKCSSLTKINQYGDIIDNLIIPNFDNGNHTPIIRIEDSLFISGHGTTEQLEKVTFAKTTTDLTNYHYLEYFADDEYQYINEGLIYHNGSIYSFGDTRMTSNGLAQGYVIKWQTSLSNLDTIFKFSYGDLTNQIKDLQVINDNRLAAIIFTKYLNEAKDYYNIIEFDTLGNVLSRYEYSDFPTSQLFTNLSVLPDGDYIVSSNNIDEKPVLEGVLARLKSQSGDIIWKIRLPQGENNFREYSVYDIQLASNGDILLCGKVFDLETQFISYWAGFICRITQDGEIVWNRIYKIRKENPAAPRLYKTSNLRSVHELSNGDIAAVGYATRYNENVEPRLDMWVLRVGQDGCLYDDCEEEQLITSIEDVNENIDQIAVYPNPTTGLLNITTEKGYELIVYDLFGNMILRKQIGFDYDIDISFLPDGMYFFQFRREGKHYVEKVVKAK